MRKIDKDHFVQARRYSPNSKAKMYSKAVKRKETESSYRLSRRGSESRNNDSSDLS